MSQSPYQAVKVIITDDELKRQEKFEAWSAESTRILQEMPGATDFEHYIFTLVDLQTGAALQNLENLMATQGLFAPSLLIKLYLGNTDETTLQALTIVALNMREGIHVLIHLTTGSGKIKEKDLRTLKAVDPEPFRRILQFSTGKESNKKIERKGSAVSRLIKLMGMLKFAPQFEYSYAYVMNYDEMMKWFPHRIQSAYPMLELDKGVLELLMLGSEKNSIAVDQFLRTMAVLLPAEAAAGIAVPTRNKNGQTTYVLTQDLLQKYYSQEADYSGYEFTSSLVNRDFRRSLHILTELNNDAWFGNYRTIVNIVEDILHIGDIVRNDPRQYSKMGYAQLNSFLKSHSTYLRFDGLAAVRFTLTLSEKQFSLLRLGTTEAACALATMERARTLRALQRLATVGKNTTKEYELLLGLSNFVNEGSQI